MKNTLGDLNNHLFAQLEKLGDDDLTGEEFGKRVKENRRYMRHQRADHQKWRATVQGDEAHGRVWVRKTEGSSGNARSSCRGGEP